jgi:hypothetical protein
MIKGIVRRLNFVPVVQLELQVWFNFNITFREGGGSLQQSTRVGYQLNHAAVRAATLLGVHLHTLLPDYAF